MGVRRSDSAQRCFRFRHTVVKWYHMTMYAARYLKWALLSQPFRLPSIHLANSQSVCSTIEARRPSKCRLKWVIREEGNATKSPLCRDSTNPGSYKHRSPSLKSPTASTMQRDLSLRSRWARVATFKLTTRDRNGCTTDCAFPGNTSASALRTRYSSGSASSIYDNSLQLVETVDPI